MSVNVTKPYDNTLLKQYVLTNDLFMIMSWTSNLESVVTHEIATGPLNDMRERCVSIVAELDSKLFESTREWHALRAKLGTPSWATTTALEDLQARFASLVVEKAANDESKAIRIATNSSRLVLFLGPVQMPFVWIPPGECLVGSPSNETARATLDAESGKYRPQRIIRVEKGFWMSQYEVTIGQWRKALDCVRMLSFPYQSYYPSTNSLYSFPLLPGRFSNGPLGPCLDAMPIEGVNIYDCEIFLSTFNSISGMGNPNGIPGLFRSTSDVFRVYMRLPKPEEWEYACRAGSQTPIYSGEMKVVGTNNAPDLDEIAWYAGNSGVYYPCGVDSTHWPQKQYQHTRAGVHPVGQKRPNAFGLYDMLGNVAEICDDNIRRGGSWRSAAADCRSSSQEYPEGLHELQFHHFEAPSNSNREDDVGFRVIADVVLKKPK
jgi:formylglycine-generating enzyme required for sulfatase activity